MQLELAAGLTSWLEFWGMLVLTTAAHSEKPEVCTPCLQIAVLNVHVSQSTGYLDLCSSIAELAMCPPSRLKFWEVCLE